MGFEAEKVKIDWTKPCVLRLRDDIRLDIQVIGVNYDGVYPVLFDYIDQDGHAQHATCTLDGRIVSEGTQKVFNKPKTATVTVWKDKYGSPDARVLDSRTDPESWCYNTGRTFVTTVEVEIPND